MLSPANDSFVYAGPVNFTWINNGDPDGDYVCSILVGRLNGEGEWLRFNAGDQETFSVNLPSGVSIEWNVAIYDPNKNSDPFYTTAAVSWWIYTP